MRAALLGLIAVMTAAACATPAEPESVCPAVATSGADVDAVVAAEQRVSRLATESATLAEAVTVFAPEFQLVLPNGEVQSIDQVVGAFTNGRSEPWAVRFEIRDIDVTVRDCATAHVVMTAEVLPRGASAPMLWRYSNDWRKEDGAWLYARGQYVAVPRDPTGS